MLTNVNQFGSQCIENLAEAMKQNIASDSEGDDFDYDDFEDDFITAKIKANKRFSQIFDSQIFKAATAKMGEEQKEPGSPVSSKSSGKVDTDSGAEEMFDNLPVRASQTQRGRKSLLRTSTKSAYVIKSNELN